MTNEEMLKQDLERAVKELGLDGSNTKQRVKYLLEECLEVYFKPKKYLTYKEAMKLNPSKTYKVKLNGSIYDLDIKIDILDDKYKHYCLSYETSSLNGRVLYYHQLTVDWCDDEQFFNDLHLELVEE